MSSVESKMAQAQPKSVNVEQEVQQLKKKVENMYLPQHLEHMMRKVGVIETSLSRTEHSMHLCYSVVFFTLFLVTVFIVVLAYALWRLGVFHEVFPGVFGRVSHIIHRPRYRPKSRRRVTPMKPSFSADEALLMPTHVYSSDSE